MQLGQESVDALPQPTLLQILPIPSEDILSGKLCAEKDDDSILLSEIR